MRHRAHQVDLGIPHPESLLGHPQDTKPSFEAFFERLTRNFTGEDVPKGEHPESLTLDVLLSPLEAMAGCAIPVEVPRFHRCPQCAGSGDVLPFRCASCGGSGQIEEVRELLIEVPPGVRSGTIFEAPLDLFGISNLYLRVHISISAR